MTTTAAPDHAARFAKDGYSIVPDAIDAKAAAEAIAEIERLERELSIKPAENLFEGFKTNRVYNLLARGKIFEELVENEAVLAAVEALLGKGFLVSTVSSIAIEPGETAQPIHADDMLIPIARPHQPLTCTVMWALSDFTRANGATRILPGTHLSPDVPQLGHEYDEAVACEMPVGSALVYNGSMWHGGGANTSTVRRVGLAVGYCVGWMRQQENQQLGIPREIAKGFSPRLRKLVGYGIYKGLYGHIDKCSPVDLLDETGPRVIVGVMK
ncbi:MAG: phytanoyl-CoA dioxygenase [Polyangiaceae bacterium]|nr:phytanoyl-CoA dioxygenase [Polyangiaceae bacterium]